MPRQAQALWPVPGIGLHLAAPARRWPGALRRRPWWMQLPVGLGRDEDAAPEALGASVRLHPARRAGSPRARSARTAAWRSHGLPRSGRPDAAQPAPGPALGWYTV